MRSLRVWPYPVQVLGLECGGGLVRTPVAAREREHGLQYDAQKQQYMPCRVGIGACLPSVVVADIRAEVTKMAIPMRHVLRNTAGHGRA